MSKSVKLGLVLVAVCVIAGAFVALSAASPKAVQATPVIGAKTVPLTDVLANRKLLASTISYGSPWVNLPAGQTPIDSPLTFKCPTGHTCTVSVEQFANFGNNFTPNSRFGFCSTLDGFGMSQPVCSYQGELLSDGNFIGGSMTQNASGIQPGLHTVQTSVQLDAAAQLGIYSITYRLYTP